MSIQRGDYRWTQVLAAGILLLALLAGRSSPASAAESVVRVPADVEWVNTGIWVEAGQTAAIAVEGLAITAPLSRFPDKFAPGWEITNCGTDMDPGLRDEWGGKKNVLVTHPLDQSTGCVLSKKINLSEAKKAKLLLVVGHDPQGDFDLIVRVNGKELLRKAVGKATATDDPWLAQEVDLSAFAGRKAPKIELINQPSGWAFEAAYWAEIKVVTE